MPLRDPAGPALAVRPLRRMRCRWGLADDRHGRGRAADEGDTNQLNLYLLKRWTNWNCRCVRQLPQERQHHLHRRPGPEDRPRCSAPRSFGRRASTEIKAVHGARWGCAWASDILTAPVPSSAVRPRSSQQQVRLVKTEIMGAFGAPPRSAPPQVLLHGVPARPLNVMTIHASQARSGVSPTRTSSSFHPAGVPATWQQALIKHKRSPPRCPRRELRPVGEADHAGGASVELPPGSRLGSTPSWYA